MKTATNISVALCTYNGEKFIIEQLQSIVRQTLPPAEIIICDDCSEDSTLPLIEKFSGETNIPIRIYRNEQRLGVTSNFKKAIGLCNGNYIALSDQDDVWLKEKLEKQFSYLVKHPNYKVVFTDLLIVDEKLRSLDQTMWGSLNFNSRLKKQWRRGRSLDILTKHGNLVTGSTLLFDASCKKIFEEALSYQGRIWIHDGLIALTAARNNQVGLLDEVTVLYRQHSQQVIGVTPQEPVPIRSRLRKLATQRLNVVKELEELLTSNKKHKEDLVDLGFSEKKLSWLNKLIRHLTVRRNLPKSRIKRIPLILKELVSLRYLKYSGSLVMQAIKDWLVKRSLLLA